MLRGQGRDGNTNLLSAPSDLYEYAHNVALCQRGAGKAVGSSHKTQTCKGPLDRLCVAVRLTACSMTGSVCVPKIVSASHEASRIFCIAPKPTLPRHLALQVLNQGCQLRAAMICNNQLSTAQAVCKHTFKPVKRLHVLRRPVRECSQQASRRCRRCSSVGTPMQTKAAGDVFALDFDGVMVDSEPEVSELVARQSTAIRADCVTIQQTFRSCRSHLQL